MKLSIIVPVYNVADYLPRCLDSLLAQDMPPDEILLIDDGSTDGRSGAICDAYALRDPERIRAFHFENRGIGSARNIGIEKAAGDYLLFVDGDDAVSPHLVSSLRSWMERGMDAAVFGFRVERGGSVSEEMEIELTDGTVTSLREMPQLLLSLPCVWNKLWRRSLFTENGIRFPEGILYEDLAITGRLLACAGTIAILREPLYTYVVRSESAMHSRNPERDRDILAAVDSLVEWYRRTDRYGRYRKELEAVAVQHILLTASVRVARADPRSPVLRDFREAVEKSFPDWHGNPYIREFPVKHRFLLWLIERRQFRLIRWLFLIKG